jgi:hypothetical protein
LTETLEHTARRIAEHGREALLARLRPAFEEAAAAHRDALELDDEQLEQMVQRAADRADGLQWRRALASVATEQLGIGLGEALSHPAVARAQAIVGAPSYEEALSALRAGAPAPPVEKTAKAGPEHERPANKAADRHEEVAEEQADAEAIAEEEEEEEEDVEVEPPEGTAEYTPVAAAQPELGDDADDGVRLRAVHLGGIANLAPAESDLELHISSVGLDIIRGPEQSVLGRLTWDEIVALETPAISGRFRRRRPTDAHLVIRSHQGSASFEIPGVTPDELREHLDPLLAKQR